MDIQAILKQDDAHIIDVREVVEFNSGHIAGAVNMPLSVFGNFLNQLKSLKGPKIFYCRSGNRSGQAVDYLSQLGIPEVYNGGSLVLMEAYLLPAS